MADNLNTTTTPEIPARGRCAADTAKASRAILDMENPKNNIEAYVQVLFGVANDTDVDENLTMALVRIARDIQREVREIDRLFTTAHDALRPDSDEQEAAHV